MNHISFDEIIHNAIAAKHEPLILKDQMSEDEYRRFVFQMILARLREAIGISLGQMADHMNLGIKEYKAIEHPIVCNIVSENTLYKIEAILEQELNAIHIGDFEALRSLDSLFEASDNALIGADVLVEEVPI